MYILILYGYVTVVEFPNYTSIVSSTVIDMVECNVEVNTCMEQRYQINNFNNHSTVTWFSSETKQT